jgi:hypothetical protein
MNATPHTANTGAFIGGLLKNGRQAATRVIGIYRSRKLLELIIV